MAAKTLAHTAVPERVEVSAGMRYALLVLAAVLLFGVFSREIYDSDFWWHLRSGQYIVEQHRLPAPDPFSWTTAMTRDTTPGEAGTRQFNLTMEWLAQVAFYGLWRVGGSAAIVAARALSMTAMCGLIGLIAWRRRQSWFAALFAAFACTLVARNFALDRPYQVTFLALAATMALLEFRRWLWLLPPLFVVWANCHAGFFLGWVVLGAWCAESLAARRIERSLWVWSAAAVLASGLNPNGFRIVNTLLAYRGSFLVSRVNEWARPAMWPPSAFTVLLAIAAVVLVLARRRVRVADWLIFAAFAGAALSARRNVILMGLAAPVMIAGYAPWKERARESDTRSDGKLKHAPHTPWNVRIASWGPAVAAVLMLIALGAGFAQGSFFQLRSGEWKVPKGAADFLLRHGVRERMYNSYEYGGYLIWRLWPQERTFIDGRGLSESVFQDYARILYNHDASDGQPDAEALLDRYGVQVIVMNTMEAAAGLVYSLAPALADPAQSRWKLVYNDAQAVIFMRTPPAGVAVLNSLDVLTHMEEECAVHLEHEPESPGCARSLGQVFSKVGDFGRARKWLGIYLEHPHARDEEAENAYRQMLGVK